MPGFTAAATIGGLVTSAGGLIGNLVGQGDLRDAQASIQGYLQRQEELRRQQMELEASRRKREIVRQGVLARSVALTRGTGQGINAQGGGSTLPGAFAGIAGQTGFNLLGINQNLEIGRNLFETNQGLLAARYAESQARSDIALSQGLFSLGQSLVSNAPTIGSVGKSLLA